jgi:hypothetical protein
MDINKFFPTFTTEEILERVNKYWDLSCSLPFPKFDLGCSVCKSDEILLRQWLFHDRSKRTGSKHGYRCDVSFKCTQCSFVWVHGILVPKEMFEKYRDKRMVTWRKVKEILEREKYSAE